MPRSSRAPTGCCPIPAGVALSQSAFYRVRGVPVATPLDSDGDGLDDVYELLRRLYLDPLNPNDGLKVPATPVISYPTNALNGGRLLINP